MSETTNNLDAHWRSACKIIFGEDVGPMTDYANWLLELTDPVVHKKSAISGKEVTLAYDRCVPGSKFISNDEVDYGKRFPAAALQKINSINDLLPLISDRLSYTGNVILGKSEWVERSSNITDCFFMYSAGKLVECKYVAYSTWGRECEDDFGSNGIGSSSMCIKCKETFQDRRCLELWFGQNCSDCHFSYALVNCQDCLFCFHLKAKKHCIGNLQLTPEEYQTQKKRIMGEMAAYLRENKRLPSLTELVKGSKIDPFVIEAMKRASKSKSKISNDKAPVEEAYLSTTKLLFGKSLLGGLDAYRAWLMKHKRAIRQGRSCISGKDVMVGDYCCAFELPTDRLINMGEAPIVAEFAKLAQTEVQRLGISTATELLGKIAFFSPEYYEGKNTNIIDCPTAMDASDCYHSTATVFCKFCAFGTWPRSSEYCFGYDSCLSSKSCINCYQSVRLSRCFEMDNCRDCSDCYFCHNAENCSECMFCFNVKAKRYAIGNVEYPKEEYLRIKKLVLEEISNKLVKDKKLDLDIYNIGV